ncbi:hypothetical protein [Mycobacterium sp. MMS18-G62]
MSDAVAVPGYPLGNVMQLAWATTNLDKSLEQFREIYKVPEFLVMEQKFPADVFGEKGEMHLRLALANVDNIQFELIEPIGDGVNRIYRDELPRDGNHANVFHHICVKVDGDLSDWDSHLAALGTHQPIVYTGDLGPGARVVYTDERDSIGMYVEHVWFGPELEAQMAAMIPSYTTNP